MEEDTKKIEGEHYDGSSIAAPVTNDATIRIMLVLMLLASWIAQIVDVNGAFLYGVLDANEKIYMEVPEGFESKYPKNNVLLLQKNTVWTQASCNGILEEIANSNEKNGI